MSKKFKFVLDRQGVRNILKSDGMQNILNEYGQRALSTCGVGYEMEQRKYPERSGVVIKAESIRAKIDNSKNNTLLKALGGAKK